MLFSKKIRTDLDDIAGLVFKHLSGDDLDDDILKEIVTILNDEIIRSEGLSVYSYGDNGELMLFASTYDDDVWLEAQREAINVTDQYRLGSVTRMKNMLSERYISKKVVPELLKIAGSNYEYGFLVSDCRPGDEERVAQIFEDLKNGSTPAHGYLYNGICLMLRHGGMRKALAGVEKKGQERKQLLDKMDRENCYLLMTGFVCTGAAFESGRMENELFRQLAELTENKDLYHFDDLYVCMFEKSMAGQGMLQRCISNLNAVYAGRNDRPAYIECEVDKDESLLALYACEKRLRSALPGKTYSLYYDRRMEKYREIQVVGSEDDNGAGDDLTGEEAEDAPEVEVVAAETETVYEQEAGYEGEDPQYVDINTLFPREDSESAGQEEEVYEEYEEYEEEESDGEDDAPDDDFFKNPPVKPVKNDDADDGGGKGERSDDGKIKSKL